MAAVFSAIASVERRGGQLRPRVKRRAKLTSQRLRVSGDVKRKDRQIGNSNVGGTCGGGGEGSASALRRGKRSPSSTPTHRRPSAWGQQLPSPREASSSTFQWGGTASSVSAGAESSTRSATHLGPNSLPNIRIPLRISLHLYPRLRFRLDVLGQRGLSSDLPHEFGRLPKGEGVELVLEVGRVDRRGCERVFGGDVLWRVCR